METAKKLTVAGNKLPKPSTFPPQNYSLQFPKIPCKCGSSMEVCGYSFDAEGADCAVFKCESCGSYSSKKLA